MKDEVWKTIEGFPNYQISDKGNVRSLNYNKTGKIRLLKGFKTPKGYFIVDLFKNRKRCTITVARLVANAFIDNPENKSQINHIDGNKENNKIDNLEWCTNGENQLHAYKTGLKKKPVGNRRSAKLTEEQVREIRRRVNSRSAKHSEIAEEFGIHVNHVSNIIERKSWKDV